MREIVSFSKEIEFKTMVHVITGISLEHNLKLTDDTSIQGDFIVSGTYKMTGASQIEEDFNYKIPVDIAIDDKYDTASLSMDIYDFTYEVINEEVLKLFIELSLDNLEVAEVESIIEDNDSFAEFDDLALVEEPLNYDAEKNLNREEVIEKDFDEEINVIDEKEEFTPKVEDLFKEIETYKDVLIPVVKEEVTLEEEQGKEENSDESVNISADSIFMAFSDTKETYSTYSVYVVQDGDNVEEILNKYKVTREKLEEYNDLSAVVKGGKLIIPSLNE